MERNLINDDYNEKVHRIGRATDVIGLLFIFLVPSVICLRYNIFPPLKNLFAGIISIWMIEIPISLTEVLTYCPMLGTAGSYIAFLSGNLTNLKIPCASMCMDSAHVKPATKEGEIISTISIAASTIMTEIIILIGVLLIVQISPILTSPVLAPAFQNILPALFGALGIYFISKDWKLSIAPLFGAIIISALFPVPIAILIPICGLISITAARVMYKKGII